MEDHSFDPSADDIGPFIKIERYHGRIFLLRWPEIVWRERAPFVEFVSPEFGYTVSESELPTQLKRDGEEFCFTTAGHQSLRRK